ncbi:MAG: LamG-like jellyroll fold domain-containing protein [Bacteroidota bacterium]
MAKQYRHSYLLGFCLLFVTVLRSQRPAISYDAYKIFTKDSVIPALYPVNTGGEIPHKIYSETQLLAGSGLPSFKDGKGKAAGFDHPSAIAVDHNGTLYVTDEKNNSIRKILPDGTVSTISKTGFKGPSGIAVDALGNIYVADCYNHCIKKILPSGIVTILAGNGLPGNADHRIGTSAMFSYPVSIAVDPKGNVYVSDEGNNCIRKIKNTGEVTTLAGTGFAGATDNTNGKLASFNQPSGIALDIQGNVYVADQLNHKIRKITTAGAVTTLAGTGLAGSSNHSSAMFSAFNNPRGIAVDKVGNVYVADIGNQQIRKISSDGDVITFAGSGAEGSTDDTNGLLASFNFPNGLAIDSTGNLYIADCLNNRIRKIETNGFAISPALLPEGIQFDRTNGSITGTPTFFSKGVNYTVSAYNQYGSSKTSLGIAVSAQPGNALYFTRNNGQVFISDNPGLTPEEVTVEMWVNTGPPTQNIRFLVKRTDNTAFDESYSLGVDVNGHFFAVMSSGSGKPGSQVGAWQQQPSTYGKWYFITGLFKKDSVSLYVNGILEQTVCSGFPVSQGKNPLVFAFDKYAFFKVDEVRVFNTDRSKELLKDMVNIISPATPGLIAYYNCNLGDPAGNNKEFTTLYDLSPNNNHGKMQDFVVVNSNPEWVESYAMVVPIPEQAHEVTTTGFTMQWAAPHFGIAENYLVDISEDALFKTFLPGYNSKQVKDTKEKVVGLAPNTWYYYRVCANKSSVEGQGAYSATIRVKTLQ